MSQRTVTTCDCCSKDVSGFRNEDDTIFVIFDAGQYHHLCVSCANKNISRMVTGLYPKESQEVIRMLMGGRPAPDDLKFHPKEKLTEADGESYGDPCYPRQVEHHRKIGS
jgi:hypothetical protein